MLQVQTGKLGLYYLNFTTTLNLKLLSKGHDHLQKAAGKVAAIWNPFTNLEIVNLST